MKPHKVFGFLFFETKYDRVIKEANKKEIEKQYDIVLARYIIDLKKSNPEYKSMKKAQWDEFKKPIEEEFNRLYEQEKKEEIKERLEREQIPLMSNLPATINDAKQMFTFLDDFLV